MQAGVCRAGWVSVVLMVLDAGSHGGRSVNMHDGTELSHKLMEG